MTSAVTPTDGPWHFSGNRQMSQEEQEALEEPVEVLAPASAPVPPTVERERGRPAPPTSSPTAEASQVTEVAP